MSERTASAASPRVVMASATGGLVALASAGTALLVLTGASAVSSPSAAVPPLPAERPTAARPGVVVVPSADPVSGRTTAAGRSGRITRAFAVTAPQTVVSLPTPGPGLVLVPLVPPAAPPLSSVVDAPVPALHRPGSDAAEPVESPGHLRAGHVRSAHSAGSHVRAAAKAGKTSKAGKPSKAAKTSKVAKKSKAASYRGKADRPDERG